MKQINVLVVDDDHEVLETLAEILAELRLHPVTAADGVEALEQLKTRQIDLIITDLMMPHMDGFALIEQTRQLEMNIPIAVISGYGEVRNVVEALTRGAYNFITKPFTIKEIEQIVKRGLRLREYALGTGRLLEGITNRTEMSIPSYPHLLPSVGLYVVRECQWRGIEDDALLTNISICIDELLNNALVHGNDLDPALKISLEMVFDQQSLTVSIADEGRGFSYGPLLTKLQQQVENLPTKRGLFIVNYLMDELAFNDRGNRVTVVKHLVEPGNSFAH